MMAARKLTDKHLFTAIGGSLLLHLVAMIGVQLPVATPLSTAQTASEQIITAQLESVHKDVGAVYKEIPRRIPVAQPIAASPLTDQRAASTAAEESALPSLSEPVTNEAGYYATDQLDIPPRLLGEVQQIYPSRARTAEIEGFVTLVLLINERGIVDEISVAMEQPQGYFAEAALTMLRQQRFTPALKQNRAVKSRWLTTVRYRLQDSL